MSEPFQTTLRLRPVLALNGEAFFDLCQANPDLRMELSACGDLEIMSPSGANSGRRNSEISGQLWAWNRANGRGLAFDSSSGFTLPNGAVRAPDAAWIARERWESIPIDKQDRFAPICPDFVAELRSPSDSKPALREKLREYVDQGARLGWLLDPLDGTAEVYRPGRPVEVLQRPATLSGEGVLPGFVLDTAEILLD